MKTPVLAASSVRTFLVLSFFSHCLLLFWMFSDPNARRVSNELDYSISNADARGNSKFSQNYESINRSPSSRFNSTRMINSIPLANLVATDRNVVCPGPDKNEDHGNKQGETLTLVKSIILDESITHPHNRRIPRIIHVTSKSRCMHPYFVDNLARWELENHSFYFHDEAAVERLLGQHWPEFPHLQLVLSCTLSGAAKADLWRLLVLWEYGGVYTDIDNAPGPLFKNGTAIHDDDDSFFVVERIGVLSQYFMAASPKHPLIHIAILVTLGRILEVISVGLQNVPWVSGPEAMRQSMIVFMRSQGTGIYQRMTSGYVLHDGH
jgi:hypothetical protein